jgi:hypothetical protein
LGALLLHLIALCLHLATLGVVLCFFIGVVLLHFSPKGLVLGF